MAARDYDAIRAVIESSAAWVNGRYPHFWRHQSIADRAVMLDKLAAYFPLVDEKNLRVALQQGLQNARCQYHMKSFDQYTEEQREADEAVEAEADEAAKYDEDLFLGGVPRRSPTVLAVRSDPLPPSRFNVEEGM